MSPSDPADLVGRVRHLTTRYRSGTAAAFGAFRELVGLLLHVTVVSEHQPIFMTKGPHADTRLLGGSKPLRLNDGRYLRVVITLFREPTTEGMRLKVAECNYQYQVDTAGDRWIFRYDYRRTPRDQHPAAHLQIRGDLSEACLPPKTPIERVHFPTGRISLEAVIRLLVEQFRVRCNEPPDVWRPILTESESGFLKIAHQTVSGPDH